MKTDVAIIGGGIAGLWCAYELSRLGFRSVIVEQDTHLGGHVAFYCCKATDKCQRCGACLLEDVLDTIQSSDKISYRLKTSISHVERSNGSFRLRLLGLEGAGDEISVDASSIILATGFKPFDAGEKPRFGYGRVKGVITGFELDQMLRADNFDFNEGEKPLRSVAFIQCVGSRDPRIGRNYCSRVCCGYALRLARLLRNRFPEIEPSMFYMDIQTFDRDFEHRLEIARKEVRLIRAIPAEIRSGSDGRPELIYHGPNDEKLYESFDMVVLSIGISPNPAVAGLAQLLEVPLNEDAFLGVNGDKVTTGSSGVFVAGAAQGPKSIEESVSHAILTAANVASYLNRSGQGDKS